MTISNEQPELPEVKIHNQTYSFEEGFFLTPQKLRDIVKSINENTQAKSYDFHLEISVEYIRNRDKKSIEIKPFKGVEELVNDNNTLNKAIKSIRLITRNKNYGSSNQNNIECIINYGSQDSTPLRNKSARVSLKVSGTDNRSMNQISHDISEEIKRTLMNLWFSRFIRIVNSLRVPIFLLFISIHIILLLLLGFRLEAFPPTASNLENAKKQLQILYEKSENISTESEKIDFLFQERILQNKIQALSEMAPQSSRIIQVKWKQIFQVVLSLLVCFLLFISFAFLYPLENFMWGDYESNYNNLKQFREVLIISIVGAILINLITGVF